MTFFAETKSGSWSLPFPCLIFSFLYSLVVIKHDHEMFTPLPAPFDIAQKLLQGTRVIDLPWVPSSAQSVIDTKGSSPSPPPKPQPTVHVVLDV